MKYLTNNHKIVVISAFVMMMMTYGFATNAYALFHAKDFKITNFGIHNHTPFLKIKGKAGGSKPVNLKTIYGYVFKTNTGIFGVVSHHGKDSIHQKGPNDTRYHAHKVTLDKNNCITALKDIGIPSFGGHILKLHDTHATKVNGVLTAKITAFSSHHICVTKVFYSKP